MTDAQMITIAVAVLVVFAGTIYNNSRITDLRDSVNRRIDDNTKIVLERMQRMEDNLTRIVGDHETRIHKLEQRDAR